MLRSRLVVVGKSNQIPASLCVYTCLRFLQSLHTPGQGTRTWALAATLLHKAGNVYSHTCKLKSWIRRFLTLLKEGRWGFVECHEEISYWWNNNFQGRTHGTIWMFINILPSFQSYIIFQYWILPFTRSKTSMLPSILWEDSGLCFHRSCFNHGPQ